MDKFVIGLGLLCLSCVAFAGEKAASGDSINFADLDADKDGALSKEELQGNGPLSKNFANIDGDKDGKISKEEFSAITSAFTDSSQ